MATIPVVAIGIGILVLLVGAIILSVWLYKRKKWNLRLEIKLARSDGKLILSDKAKGYWDAGNGWIVVKRRGYKKNPTHPIDPKRWLKGKDFATLIQVGPEDYIIADENSYSIVRDEVTGKEIALMDIIADVGKRKTWKNYTERMGKKAFTLSGWIEAHQLAITLTIVMFAMFLGFAILWTRQGSLMRNLCGVSAGMALLNIKQK